MEITEIRKKYPQYSDISDGELVRGLHKTYYSDVPYADFLRKIDFREKVDPTEGMSGTKKVLAGVGKAFTDIGRGAGQLVGEGLDELAPPTSGKTFSENLGLPSRRDVDEAKKLDAPLMATGAGKTGAIGGALVPLAALAAVPGANSIAGSALLGSTLGAIEPVGTDESRTKNALIGGAVGGGASAAMKGVGAGANALLNRSTAQGAAAASQNAVRDATVKAAQAEGYVIPPSAIGGGKTLETIGGKAATGQEAAIRNQEVTNRIARKEAGLAADTPISESSLAAARKELAEPYREVAALSKPAAKALEDLKSVRTDSKNYWQFFNRTGDPEALKKAQQFDLRADKLEGLIEKEAAKLTNFKQFKSDSARAAAEAHGIEQGQNLVESLREARKAIAKNYDVERALNVGNGNIDAHAIGRMLDKRGEQGVTGGLQTIGRFAEAFGNISREAGAVPAPGVSKLMPYGSIALGAIGAGASEHYAGSPYGAAAAALPLLSGPARSLALSKMMRPGVKYGPGSTLRLSDLAANDPRLRGMVPLSAVGSTLETQQQ